MKSKRHFPVAALEAAIAPLAPDGGEEEGASLPTSRAPTRTMDARVVLTLLAGCCWMLVDHGVQGKNVRARAAETSRSGCTKTIISNNGDTTKFSFEMNYPAAKVTHCLAEAGERESWTIEPLSSGDAIKELSINGDSTMTTDGKGTTSTDAECQKKNDQLTETIAKLESRIQENMSSAAKASGYHKIGNLSARYKMHPVAKTWIQAKNTCEQEGAHLLVINNAAERDVVPSLFNQAPTIEDADWNDWAWIGVHDTVSEGDFWTVLGQRLSSIGYAYWVTGRPILNTKENCVSVDKRGAMYDSECDKKAPYICEL